MADVGGFTRRTAAGDTYARPDILGEAIWFIKDSGRLKVPELVGGSLLILV